MLRAVFIEACLPSPADKPPSGANWIHEIKHDGYRLMARRDPVGIRLIPGRMTGRRAVQRQVLRGPRFVSPFIDGSGRARHNRLGMPRGRIEIYWKKSETAPEGVIAQVRVTDGCGSDYLLPYPCKLTKDGWVNAASGKLLAVRPTYWKLYVETLSRKKPRERSPQLNPPQAERD